MSAEEDERPKKLAGSKILNSWLDFDCLVPVRVQGKFFQLLAEHPEGILLTKLDKLYQEKYGFSIDVFQYATRNVQELVNKLPKVFRQARVGMSNIKLFHAQQPIGPEEALLREAKIDLTPVQVKTNIRKLLSDAKEMNPSVGGVFVDELVCIYQKTFRMILDFVSYELPGLDEFIRFHEGSLFNVQSFQGRGILVQVSSAEEQVSLSSNRERACELDEIRNNAELMDLFPADCLSPADKLPVIDLDAEFQVGKECLISLTHITNCGEFRIHLSKNVQPLEELLAKMQDFYSCEEKIVRLPKWAVVNKMFCVTYNHNKEWRRAQITGHIGLNAFRCHFVDFGYFYNLNRNNLYCLHKDFAELPIQAVSARLAHAKPLLGTEWPAEANKRFQYLVEGADLNACIVECDSKERIVTVSAEVRTARNLEVDVLQLLVTEGFARNPGDFEDDQKTKNPGPESIGKLPPSVPMRTDYPANASPQGSPINGYHPDVVGNMPPSMPMKTDYPADAGPQGLPSVAATNGYHTYHPESCDQLSTTHDTPRPLSASSPLSAVYSDTDTAEPPMPEPLLVTTRSPRRHSEHEPSMEPLPESPRPPRPHSVYELPPPLVTGNIGTSPFPQPARENYYSHHAFKAQPQQHGGYTMFANKPQQYVGYPTYVNKPPPGFSEIPVYPHGPEAMAVQTLPARSPTYPEYSQLLMAVAMGFDMAMRTANSSTLPMLPPGFAPANTYHQYWNHPSVPYWSPMAAAPPPGFAFNGAPGHQWNSTSVPYGAPIPHTATPPPCFVPTDTPSQQWNSTSAPNSPAPAVETPSPTDLPSQQWNCTNDTDLAPAAAEPESPTEAPSYQWNPSAAHFIPIDPAATAETPQPYAFAAYALTDTLQLDATSATTINYESLPDPPVETKTDPDENQLMPVIYEAVKQKDCPINAITKPTSHSEYSDPIRGNDVDHCSQNNVPPDDLAAFDLLQEVDQEQDRTAALIPVKRSWENVPSSPQKRALSNRNMGLMEVTLDGKTLHKVLLNGRCYLIVEEVAAVCMNLPDRSALKEKVAALNLGDYVEIAASRTKYPMLYKGLEFKRIVFQEEGIHLMPVEELIHFLHVIGASKLRGMTTEMYSEFILMHYCSSDPPQAAGEDGLD